MASPILPQWKADRGALAPVYPLSPLRFRLLGDKLILGHILAGCIDDFRGMDPAEVASLIKGEPAIGSVPAEPGLMNARKVGKNSPDAASTAGSAAKGGQSTIGMNTESSEVGEGLIRYDVIFYARRPWPFASAA